MSRSAYGFGALFACALGMSVMLPGQASADGALAVGVPDNVSRSGFAYGYAYNNGNLESAQASALRSCQTTQAAAQTARSVCRVIGTFRNQCIAFAMDPKAGTPGIGWGVAPDMQTAQANAMAHCVATAGASRQRFCKIDKSACDSSQGPSMASVTPHPSQRNVPLIQPPQQPSPQQVAPSVAPQFVAPVVPQPPQQLPQDAQAPSGPDVRVALVIGNGAYQHASVLPNPANDAADVAESLRRLGYEVVEGRNLDKREMENKIREFGRKLDRANVALFYYAGHGMQVSSKNYLMPVDARLESQSDLNFETIDISMVLQMMEASRRVNLVFLDACRDNPLSRSMARTMGTRSSTVGQGLAQIRSAVGTMIAYSTQPDNVALDGTGRNSPFTTAMLRHMGTRGLNISVMMQRVRADVLRETNERQVPWDHSSLIGEVVLAR